MSGAAQLRIVEASNRPEVARRNTKFGRRKRHSRSEVAAKLAEADALIESGMRHHQVARALGVSVMTYHRWRKARLDQDGAQPDEARRGEERPTASPEAAWVDQAAETGRLQRIADLELENSRLRSLVTDLLLDMIKGDSAPARKAAIRTVFPYPSPTGSCDVVR